jgi:6-phosphogluconolactonase (cycloisomerase 2 family)
MSAAPTARRLATVAAASLAALAPTSLAAVATASTLDDPVTWNLPGDKLFPEGMGVDTTTGFFYTGSLTDGSIVRGSIYRTDAETFLPAGGDGRTSTLGVRPSGNLLYVAGGASGHVWVYDIRTKALLANLKTGAKTTLTNDIAVAPDGSAYVSDSYSPFVYRITRTASGGFKMRKWVSFAGTAFHYSSKAGTINADGIAVTPDGRYVLVNALTAGRLYRIDVATKQVKSVRRGGANLVNADGMVIDGRVLYVVRNADGVIAKLKLSPDASRVVSHSTITSPTFRFPTAVGLAPGRLLVLNAQLDAFFGASSGVLPTLPFTVTGINR